MKTSNQSKNKQVMPYRKEVSTTNSNEVDFSVSHGHVLLKGAVDTRSLKEDIEKTVTRIPGVISLKNRISVQQVDHTRKSDMELSEEISRALKQITPVDSKTLRSFRNKKTYNKVKDEIVKGGLKEKNFEMDYWKVFVND